MKSLSIQDWGVVFSVVVSLAAGGYMVYRDFFEGPKLQCSLDQVVLVRVPGANKQGLSIDMLLDDLLSSAPSKQAAQLIQSFERLPGEIASGNRDRIKAELIRSTAGQQILYDPSRELILRYLRDPRFVQAFYVPLVVFNAGQRVGHISSLVLTAQPKADRSKHWVFAAFVEMNPLTLLNRGQPQTDADRMAGLFSGFSVGPQDGTRVNPLFVPMKDIKTTIISKENMRPEETYYLRLFGYDSLGRIILETEEYVYVLTESKVVDAFMGTESSDLVNLENHIENALKRLR